MIKHLKDLAQGKARLGQKRSSRWPTIRKAHLEKNPECAVCGGKKQVEVHHIKPFHLHPELELEPSNLISLCESKNKGVNCHLFIGHLGSFQKMNEAVLEDAQFWAKKLK